LTDSQGCFIFAKQREKGKAKRRNDEGLFLRPPKQQGERVSSVHWDADATQQTAGIRQSQDEQAYRTALVLLLLRVLDETGGGAPDEMEEEGSEDEASEEEELTDAEARHRLFDALEDDASDLHRIRSIVRSHPNSVEGNPEAGGDGELCSAPTIGDLGSPPAAAWSGTWPSATPRRCGRGTTRDDCRSTSPSFSDRGSE
jgi:hypothetical protein